MIYPAGVALALLLLLVGCAPLGEIKPTPPDQTHDQRQKLWQQHHAQMSGIFAWRMRAKIAVVVAAKNHAKSGNATLVWEYQRERQQIELYGPFGSARVQINAQPGKAILKDTKGNRIEDTNAAQVLYQRLGWQVPFAQLGYWIRGIPSADATEDTVTITLDHAGRLQHLRQGNWLVEYQGYDTIKPFQLPRKLTITAAPGSIEIYDRDEQYIGDQLSVKIILKRWQDIQFDR